MTTPSNGSARGHSPRPVPRRGSVKPKITPVQVVTVVVVLAIFIGALVIGGAIGAGIIAVLAVLAALMLVIRWDHLDPRVRIIRLVAVFATIAVAVSVIVRG